MWVEKHQRFLFNVYKRFFILFLSRFILTYFIFSATFLHLRFKDAFEQSKPASRQPIGTSKHLNSLFSELDAKHAKHAKHFGPVISDQRLSVSIFKILYLNILYSLRLLLNTDPTSDLPPALLTLRPYGAILIRLLLYIIIFMPQASPIHRAWNEKLMQKTKVWIRH